MAGDHLTLSVVIPARNEAESIAKTIAPITSTLDGAGIVHEIIVVDDGSNDGTGARLASLRERDPRIRGIRSPYAGGFGLAVRAGLEAAENDAVAIVMADASDDPADLVTYHRLLEAGFDCAFGSRFCSGGGAHDYPRFKLLLNRLVNTAIRLMFGHGFNDTTNAFKAYRREVIDSLQPLLSHHFNLTVEIPLKAVIRGYSYAIVPVTWRNRSRGQSKFELQEMGSRYLFIILYTFLEHHLSRGDYRVRGPQAGRWRAGRPGHVGARETIRR
jgi:dolichol-phosphate mannosyltransferase